MSFSFITVFLFIAWGFFAFFMGARWGTIVIEAFRNANNPGGLAAGQKWRLPGVGMVRIVSVWPESVTYFLTKYGPGHVHVMDRKIFDECARDDMGRDPTGRFHKSIRERVLRFEVHKGDKNS